MKSSYCKASTRRNCSVSKPFYNLQTVALKFKVSIRKISPFWPADQSTQHNHPLKLFLRKFDSICCESALSIPLKECSLGEKQIKLYGQKYLKCGISFWKTFLWTVFNRWTPIHFAKTARLKILIFSFSTVNNSVWWTKLKLCLWCEIQTKG